MTEYKLLGLVMKKKVDVNLNETGCTTPTEKLHTEVVLTTSMFAGRPMNSQKYAGKQSNNFFRTEC